MMEKATLRLVVFDWAGTTVDHGCFAPVVAFMKLFESRGVAVAIEQARAPMGLEKRAHIQAMLNDPAIGAAWTKRFGRAWSESDLDALYHAFVPLQLEAIDAHCELIPGALEALRFLRSRNIRTGGTTGYFEEAALRVETLAASRGFRLDANAWTQPGQPGRPGPALVRSLMQRFDVGRSETVLKIGDTVHDVAEGLSAGAWSVAVLRGSSALGLDAQAFDALPEPLRREKLQKAGATMLDAGAHAVIESLAGVPEVVAGIERELARGVVKPQRLS